MTVFDCLHGFWRECDREPFSTSEVSLYFLLVNEANRQHWVMPIRCCTSLICFRLKTTKSNVIKARDKLRRRRMIDFVKGESKSCPSLYTLLSLEPFQAEGYVYPDNNESTVEETVQSTVASTVMHTHKDTHESTNDSTVQNTNADTVQDTLNNIEDIDKEINKERFEDEEDDNSFTPSLCSENQRLVGLDLIHDSLKNDRNWRQVVMELLACNMCGHIDDQTFEQKLNEFFLTLKASNVTKKTDSDCRKHFVNWLRISLTSEQNENNTRQRSQDRRRKADVPPATAADYHQSF